MEYILDADVWVGESGTWPAYNHAQLPLMGGCNAELKFLFMPYMAQTDEVIACLKQHPEVVVVSQSNHPNRLGEHRALVHQLMTEGLQNPVVFFQHYAEDNAEDLQIKSLMQPLSESCRPAVPVLPKRNIFLVPAVDVRSTIWRKQSLASKLPLHT